MSRNFELMQEAWKDKEPDSSAIAGVNRIVFAPALPAENYAPERQKILTTWPEKSASSWFSDCS